MVYHLPQREFDRSQTVGGDRNLASKSRFHAKWPSDRTINGPEPPIHFFVRYVLVYRSPEKNSEKLSPETIPEKKSVKIPKNP